ncbi:protein PLASTID REDOX INSENSITIVE 2, chloroplastic [Sesamum alatum]|uniref:Protein PLASTID REDOX INSENSITIVE 2, chloroplastic n=1 Tax=Sesamum alatum TaxID=300844 RepID=A0AAE1Y4X2_9LAMI|nr:protein PLASTID REDOX INSENSITIVE 2, chloroplastic [Sesamum alatum]
MRNILIIQVCLAYLLRSPNFNSRTPAYASHQMASAPLGNLIFRSPTAVPARKAIADCAILRSASLILRRPPLFYTRETFSRPPKAIPSREYVYPDPIPQFASAETQKFRAELLKKLSKEKETFGNDLHTVVNVCAEIFSEFLHKDYGGPGTLLIEPFTDMMVALKEKNLPGAPLAARASLLWAQDYVDQDWEDWNSRSGR